MKFTTGTFTRFDGPLTSLPSTASPGLKLLAAYLFLYTAEYDGLTPHHEESDFISPDAMIHFKTIEPLEEAVPWREIKADNSPAKYIDKVKYLDQVTVMELACESGDRYLVCELVSLAIHKDDPQKEKKSSEMIVFKLQPAPEGKGVEGLWVVEKKMWLSGFIYSDMGNMMKATFAQMAFITSLG